MTPAKATLLAEAADYGSRHYRKQSAYEKGRLDITLFSWLRCKPTAVRLEVGLFGAGRVSGRVHQYEPTMMHNLRRSTTEPVPADAGYSIAHVTAEPTGRKLTPFFQPSKRRGGIENHQTAEAVPTLPTLPTLLRKGGRKSTPPFAEPRVRWNSPPAGSGGCE